MNTRQAYLIYSVYRNENSRAENSRNHFHEMKFLSNAGIKFKQLKGVYKGTSELSFMIPWSDQNETHVQNTCLLYSQECYINSDSNGLTTLNAPSGKVLARLGKFREITPEQAKSIDHSMDIDTGVHFVYA